LIPPPLPKDSRETLTLSAEFLEYSARFDLRKPSLLGHYFRHAFRGYRLAFPFTRHRWINPPGSLFHNTETGSGPDQ